MALSVTHNFVSTIPDAADATLVRASNWNAAHVVTGDVGNVPVFATRADAQATDISAATNYVQLTGYKAAGDGGGGTYARVGSVPSYYVGDGQLQPTVPPNFIAGIFPTLVFSTTWWNYHVVFGPTSKPIVAGSLAFIVAFDGDVPAPATIVDSAGNTYLLAVTGTTSNGPRTTSIYYCSNPVYAPPGTTFNNDGALDVYTVPGFTGAVLDQTASQIMNSGSTGGVTLSTSTLTAAPELVVGVGYVGQSPLSAPGVVFQYSLPTGWFDLSPPLLGGRNVIGCYAASGTSPVTFAPTWSGSTAPTGTILATFKTFPKSTLNPSTWALVPSFPLHTAQYGIDPAAPDNMDAFRNFGNYLATVSAPSSGTRGSAGTTAGTVTISIGNPAIITAALAGQNNLHGLHNGQMVSFSTTGALPTGIVAGQIYYVQYGTVTPTTFQISTTSIFGSSAVNPGGQVTLPKGTPVATSGSQSGTHSMTVYGESWTDLVLDPGIYFASQNQVPGLGVGLKKWRLLGHGARIASNHYFFANSFQDTNAATAGTLAPFSAQFQSANSGTYTITLNTPALASNFYVNSWVCLMNLELQTSGIGNGNQSTFEYAKVVGVDPATGIITFLDPTQYSYRSTYPTFAAPVSGWSGGLDGPATIVQLNDLFDQEIEVRGLNIGGPDQETAGGVFALRYIDCDIWGWGYKTGPSPVNVREFTMRRCNFHHCRVEVDKQIDQLYYIDCVFDNFSYLLFQSTSINKVVIERCKMAAGMDGTAKDVTIIDSSISGGVFNIGPVYGTTERLTIINSYIQHTADAGQEGEPTLLSDVTFSSGTLKILVGHSNVFGVWGGPTVPSNNPAPWSLPGAKIAVCIEPGIIAGGALNLQGQCQGMLTVFTVLDVYCDVSGNWCIDTNLPALPTTSVTVTGTVSGTTLTVTALSPANAVLLTNMLITGGGLPAGTVITSSIALPYATNGLGNYTISNSATIGTSTAFTASIPLQFSPHSCPRLTVINSTGGRFVTDMSGASPDIPMYSYFRRAFAGFYSVVINTGPEQYVRLAGNLISWEVNVLKAYTGVETNYLLTFYIFGYGISGGNYYPTYSTQVINLKTAGKRTITATTTAGGVAGDTLVTVPFWLSGGHWITMGLPNSNPNVADTLANMPYLVMTAQTDQGIGSPSLTVTTTTSSLDELADTVTGVTVW